MKLNKNFDCSHLGFDVTTSKQSHKFPFQPFKIITTTLHTVTAG